MEYEVFLGCNIAGSIVVVLIIIYHMIATSPIKSIAPEGETHVSLKSKKSQ
jgi:hypothetical protein